MRAASILATVLLLGTSAAASPIEFVEDRRSVDFPDFDGIYYPSSPFAPWNFEILLVDGSFRAGQVSGFTPRGFQGAGSVSLEAEYQYPEGADPIAGSRGSFTFSLSRTTDIRIQGDLLLAPQADPWESWAYVSIFRPVPGGGIWSESLGMNVSGGPGPSLAFDQTLTLPAGTYAFAVDAVAQGHFAGPAASWNVVFSVPEPALLPALTLLLALCARRIRVLDVRSNDEGRRR
ncbi:MAG TPA: hypothetical protein VLC53_04830 [Myxococcota bacterium]|nr:hypothetical protein [Myxococcota bacterium]